MWLLQKQKYNELLGSLGKIYTKTVIRKEHAPTVFCDLEEAYETIWKYEIMRDLYDLGRKGRLPEFINNFLSNRTFRSTLDLFLPDQNKTK